MFKIIPVLAGNKPYNERNINKKIVVLLTNKKRESWNCFNGNYRVPLPCNLSGRHGSRFRPEPHCHLSTPLPCLD